MVGMSPAEEDPTENVAGGLNPPAGAGAETGLVEALRRGSEDAFASLVDKHYPQMLRLALMYVSSRAVAEEVVQEAWVGVLKGINRFQERSSLKTWIFHIVVNCARTRGKRESRTIPFSAQWDPDSEAPEPSVDPGRFLGQDHPQWPGHWSVRPQSWGASPEERLLAKETQEQIRRAIETLPPTQREVITLRDIDGWESDEVCRALNLSKANQRVLLHRARSRVRRALEQYLGSS